MPVNRLAPATRVRCKIRVNGLFIAGCIHSLERLVANERPSREKGTSEGQQDSEPSERIMMNWDGRIAQIAPYVAVAAAFALMFLVFAAYFQ